MNFVNFIIFCIAVILAIGAVESRSNKIREDESIDSSSSELIRRLARPAFCGFSPKVGPCKWFQSRYYYDPSSKQCKQFMYGGCRGNENNFETESECMATCK